ncbi:hypothetical protein, partial [Bacillus sp. WP8]|uniref:hypothetical protein n=1 Tax=Bacillus sp. WP8 TaxID=756828 RepID=UPI001C92EC22
TLPVTNKSFIDFCLHPSKLPQTDGSPHITNQTMSSHPTHFLSTITTNKSTQTYIFSKSKNKINLFSSSLHTTIHLQTNPKNPNST